MIFSSHLLSTLNYFVRIGKGKCVIPLYFKPVVQGGGITLYSDTVYKVIEGNGVGLW